jgi:hypothetical protein
MRRHAPSPRLWESRPSGRCRGAPGRKKGRNPIGSRRAQGVARGESSPGRPVTGTNLPSKSHHLDSLFGPSFDQVCHPPGLDQTRKPFAELGIEPLISLCQPGLGCDVKITFPSVMLQSPFPVLNAQTWYKAMGAIVSQTRAVMAEMKTASGDPKKKGQSPAGGSISKSADPCAPILPTSLPPDSRGGPPDCGCP